ncbi:alpha-(1,3)-fucosyltransferase C-like [Pomacea canaliculata]|uniref:alpha-(1,3)-fucosyltransferase C-like n=1 Tax=Pomacea canaliculata TaxID=400727 RepID=UPI000D7324DD|nr:alpha-(1,3)-fucosyltransferase C-like [Pomacea canaliculata]XP_025113816.1 alpha-(1,3)-fucosyltransferase C-like [Pomacea canaliculata]
MKKIRRALTVCLIAVVCVSLIWISRNINAGRSSLHFVQPEPILIFRKFLKYPCVNNSAQGNISMTSFVPQSIVLNSDVPLWQRHQTSQGILGYPVPLNTSQHGDNDKTYEEVQTPDHWPKFSKNYYKNPIPESPFHPNHTIRWEFDSSQLLKRPDVMSQPPKIITWVRKPRHIPFLPEPVRLRVCPEMPCRVTSNPLFQEQSSALLWSVEHMSETEPPPRSYPDQVFVFHNLEPPRAGWVCSSTYRLDSWRSAFNWTMNYRFDADILSLHGLVVKRRRPVKRNYTDILARKTKFAAWAVSSVIDQSRRKQFAAMLQKYIPIDIFGESSAHRCPRNQDDACFQTFSRDYKFYLGFENSLCKDYISEKFFRYLNLDTVLVARGSNDYKFHAPQNIFINTADFPTVKDLADHLLYLDKHPEEYIKILEAKDEYEVLFEDYPLRRDDGRVFFMHYQYEATAFCEMCRRLWNLDSYRQTIPDAGKWFDKELCYEATDLQ